ncbi:flavin reductase family protein [Flagellimonas meridianipacifica]|uniref:Flavin reductase (DIM6/NTAB) family NADH-FMN oxidoreductase RutF n=1 Tax=Flagellimonas meridianipacifica TaxID=1080225 RepID=A0A2T0M6I0_9FLAO|nr:flavin reductase [Allomuricauda pacifica]PRX53068.1 flavin reductase (DIM6/NTAB) family NADH-FMN oxidoreductase RutF [Allomuricauda pacifica]
MIHLSKKAIRTLPSRHKANLVNTVSGYKSANLIASKSKDGTTNVAIFNSVIHLGSNPALLGFVLRPLTVERHTYDNIKASSTYTINAVTEEIYKRAHATSAKYRKDESEFTKTGLTESYQGDFPSPFVKESPIQIGCSYVNEYEIQENGCILMVGAIEDIYIKESVLLDDFWAKLDEANLVSIVGLDGYAKPKITDRLSYAKPDETLESLIHGAQKSESSH